MSDSEQALMGLDVAVGSMSVGSVNWNASTFMKDNASMIVGWKRAGLTHAQIADAMNKLGFSITGKHVRNMFSKIVPLAKESEVVAFKLAIHRKFLSQPRGVGKVPPVHSLPRIDVGPASRHSSPSGTSPASVPAPRPAVQAAASARALELVVVDGEDEDMDSMAITKKPRSFGDFRRRLWASMSSDRPSPVVDFGDGDCPQVPSRLVRPLFDGAFRNWQEFIDKI